MQKYSAAPLMKKPPQKGGFFIKEDRSNDPLLTTMSYSSLRPLVAAIRKRSAFSLIKPAASA